MELPGSLSPDVVITDLKLPTLNNIDPINLIHQWDPAQRVLVLSDNLSPLIVIRALRSGALGYFVRLEDFDHFIHAIRSVYHGNKRPGN
jgi:DNA-binding NarL/FixJ family response regulator